ncbi:MAG: hypothetical protein R8J85_09630, partial [Mariprofundales bacterium]
LRVVNADKQPNLLGSIVRDIKIDANNHNTIYAATERGLFVSTDAGQSWKALSGLRKIIGDVLATALEMAPPGSPATNTYAYTLDGRWRNAAALSGASDVYTFPFHFENIGVRSRTIVYVDGVPTKKFRQLSSGVQMIGTPKGTTLQNTTISADYDTSSSIPENSPITSVVVDNYSYDNTLQHAKVIYIGTNGSGVWKTTDGGKHWVKRVAMAKQGNSFASNILSMAILPISASANATVLAGSDQGLFISGDGASSWYAVRGTTTNPLSQSVVQKILAPSLSNVWVAGKNGIFYSTNINTYAAATDSWSDVGSDIYANDPGNSDVRGLAYSSSNNLLYAITYGDVTNNSAPHGGVYVSSNKGTNWTRLSDVYSDVGAHKLDSMALYSNGNTDTLVVGSEGRAVYIDTYATATQGSWKKVVGTAPNNLTTTLFSTHTLMHSGPNSSYLQAQSSTYHPFPLPSGTAKGYITAAPSALFNGESVTFYMNIADDLGNPLAGGATVKASTTSGTISGNTSFGVTDTTSGQTGFVISLLNDVNITDPATTDPIATLSVVVTADNSAVTLQRAITMIKGLLGISSNGSTTSSCAGGSCGGTGTAKATGGSNAASGYEFSSASQNGKCTASGSGIQVDVYTCVTAANVTTQLFTFTDVYSTTGTTTETINVTDKATGQTGTLDITFTM